MKFDYKFQYLNFNGKSQLVEIWRKNHKSKITRATSLTILTNFPKTKNKIWNFAYLRLFKTVFLQDFCWHWILSINLPFQRLPTSHCRLISFCKCRRKVRHLKSQNVKNSNLQISQPSVKFQRSNLAKIKLRFSNYRRKHLERSSCWI